MAQVEIYWNVKIEVLGEKHVTEPQCSLQMSPTLLNLDINPVDNYLKVSTEQFLKQNFSYLP